MATQGHMIGIEIGNWEFEIGKKQKGADSLPNFKFQISFQIKSIKEVKSYLSNIYQI